MIKIAICVWADKLFLRQATRLWLSLYVVGDLDSWRTYARRALSMGLGKSPWAFLLRSRPLICEGCGELVGDLAVTQADQPRPSPRDKEKGERNCEAPNRMPNMP